MNNPQQAQFLSLYEPVHASFERFCRARVYGKMDYEDLMNETLLIAYQKLSSLKNKEAFLSFLIGISIRVLSNHNKKHQEENIGELHALKISDSSADTSKDAEVYLLHQALALLPEEQKECIILFEISGFSIKEIMQIQQSSESAIKQRLKRAREKLMELLNESPIKKEVSNGKTN